PEETRVQRVLGIQAEIKPNAEGVLVHGILGPKLVNTDVGILRRVLQNESTWGVERVNQGLDYWDGCGPGTIVRSCFYEIDAITKAIAFIAPKEKYFIFYDRTPGRATELVHSQRKFRVVPWLDDAIEEVARIQHVIAKELECGSVEGVATGFCDDVNLSAC